MYVYAFLTGAGRKSIFMRFVFSKFDMNKQNNFENLRSRINKWNVVMQAEIEDDMSVVIDKLTSQLIKADVLSRVKSELLL